MKAGCSICGNVYGDNSNPVVVNQARACCYRQKRVNEFLTLFAYALMVVGVCVIAGYFLL